MIPAEVVQDLLGLVLIKHVDPIDLVPDAVTIPSARDANAGRRRSSECRVVDAGRPGDCGGEYSILPALKDTRISGGMSVLINVTHLYVEGVRSVRQHVARRLALVLGRLELVRHHRGRVGQVGQAPVYSVDRFRNMLTDDLSLSKFDCPPVVREGEGVVAGDRLSAHRPRRHGGVAAVEPT